MTGIPLAALHIHHFFTAPDIGLSRLDELCPLKDLRTDIADKHERGTEITRDEAGNRKGAKHIKPQEKQHNTSNSSGKVGTVWHKRCFPVEGIARDTLRLQRPVPADISDEHGSVRNDESAGGEPDEPLKHGRAVVAGHQEGDAGDQGHGQDAVDGDAGLGAAEEEARGLAVEGERVEGARGRVEHGVAAAPAAHEDEGVDEAGEAADAEVLDADDPGARGRAGAARRQRRQQPRVPAAADGAQPHGAQHVEEEDAQPGGARAPRDVAPRVLHLARRQRDEVGPADGERRVQHHAPEAQEPPLRPRSHVLVHDLPARPVVEAVRPVGGVSAAHGDQGHEEEADQEQDFGAREHEFGFAVPPITERLAQ